MAAVDRSASGASNQGYATEVKPSAAYSWTGCNVYVDQDDLLIVVLMPVIGIPGFMIVSDASRYIVPSNARTEVAQWPSSSWVDLNKAANNGNGPDIGVAAVEAKDAATLSPWPKWWLKQVIVEVQQEK